MCSKKEPGSAAGSSGQGVGADQGRSQEDWDLEQESSSASGSSGTLEVESDQDKRRDLEEERELKQKLALYNIGRLDYFFLVLSAVLFLLDVGSDLWLGGRFLSERAYGYGCFTLAFVVGPALLANLLLGDKALWRKDLKQSSWNILWVLPYLALNLEPVRRYYRNMRRVSAFREARRKGDVPELLRCWREFTREYAMTSVMRGWEAQLEAVPQMLLQLYIMFSSGDNSPLQLFTVTTSLLGYAFTDYSWYKALFLADDKRLTKAGLAFNAVIESIPPGCRALAMASFAAVSRTHLLVAAGAVCVHWISVSVWWWCTVLAKDLSKVWWSALIGLSFTMQTPGKTTREAVVSHCMWLLEDVLLLVGCAWAGHWTGSPMYVLIPTLPVDIAARYLDCLRVWLFLNRLPNFIEFDGNEREKCN